MAIFARDGDSWWMHSGFKPWLQTYLKPASNGDHMKYYWAWKTTALVRGRVSPRLHRSPNAVAWVLGAL